MYIGSKFVQVRLNLVLDYYFDPTCFYVTFCLANIVLFKFVNLLIDIARQMLFFTLDRKKLFLFLAIQFCNFELIVGAFIKVWSEVFRLMLISIIKRNLNQNERFLLFK